MERSVSAKETEWDRFWKKEKEGDVKDVILNDRYYRLLKRLVGICKDRLNILEVGCGSGIRTLALVKDLERQCLNAVLVDLSPAALSIAKRNACKNQVKADFVLADGLRLPFQKKFDIVWNEGVNEHFEGERRQKIFEEMSLVCKGGGIVIVIVPNALNLPYRIAKKLLETSGRWIYLIGKEE